MQMLQNSPVPKINVRLDGYSQGYNVFVPQNGAYQTHQVQQDTSPYFAQNNFNQMPHQMQLGRNSSFQPSGNFTGEMNALPTFYPTNNVQMNKPPSSSFKYSHSIQHNLPQPHLMSSRSTNASIGNLRKQDSITIDNATHGPQYSNNLPFAGQQANANTYFQPQQMPNPFEAQHEVLMRHNSNNYKHQMRQQGTFEGHSDMPLTKRTFKQSTMTFDANKNFVPVSAPAKMTTKEIQSNEPLPMLDLSVCNKGSLLDEATPRTRCNTVTTNNSSQGSNPSSDSEEGASFDSIVESPCKYMIKQESIKNNRVNIEFNACSPTKSTRNNKQESGWKRKVKTELCRFWLSGLQCENQLKEQGCGFAHGQEELQKKKTLSRQYLTSVCKNFLEHPSKCTYGARCIFQHPTKDVKVRQDYTTMMEDNQRYTAMRLFQEIEGADVFYINTYAATTPRLSVFKNICNNAKDLAEDEVQEEDWAELVQLEVPNVKDILSKKYQSVAE